jgi:hypothetical protein
MKSKNAIIAILQFLLNIEVVLEWKEKEVFVRISV